MPKDGPKRKSIQSLMQYASKHAIGIKAVYAELSEATHFGAIAMWASHSIESEDESGLQTLWTSHPRWRNDEQALIACAQTLELADGLEHFCGSLPRVTSCRCGSRCNGSLVVPTRR